MLLDYYGWKLSKGESYDPLTSHSIHLEELLAVAKHQGVKFEVGDILLIRSGYTDTYYKFAAADPARLDDAGSLHPCLAGVAQTEEMKAWLHDKCAFKLPVRNGTRALTFFCIVTSAPSPVMLQHGSVGLQRNGLWFVDLINNCQIGLTESYS